MASQNAGDTGGPGTQTGGITNTLFYSGNKGEVNPSQDGWHLLTFTNGDTAIVQFENGNWKWGNVSAPAADVTSLTFLGTTYDDIASNWAGWGKAMKAVTANISNSAQVERSLIAEVDHGQTVLGHPVLINGSAIPAGGTSSQTGGASGGDATPVDPGTPAEPTLPSIGSLFGVFANQDFWKGIGLSIAGALILIFAGLEFYKLST